MKDLDTLFQQYKNLNLVLSVEEEREMLYRYVSATTQLEGNKLTLEQTIQLLSSNRVSGKDIKITDILEQKGMYKALIRMLSAVRNNEKLSIDLMIELNWLSLEHLWKYEDAYIDAKAKGQEEGKFKASNNVIRILKGGKFVKDITPFSNPENVEENMRLLIETVNHSNKHVVYKAAYLAQEIWLLQPFMDGNKRAGRLFVNFLRAYEEIT